MRQSMFVHALRATLFSFAALIASFANAQDSGRPDGVRFIPNVEEQMRALTERPEAMGFHIDGTPDPSFCKHYQGIARVESADGTPYFLLTRSGNTPGTFGAGVVCDDSDNERGWGNLVVVRMGSRDKNGERLRSNRLRKGVHADDTQPPAEDAAVAFFTTTVNGLVEGHGGSPRPQQIYQHPGGMQVIGHMMAMAMDTRANTNDQPNGDLYPKSLVQFYDVSNPEMPVLKSSFAPRSREGQQLSDADGIAITPLPGGWYLMLVISGFGPGDGDSNYRFYRSTLRNSATTPNVLERTDLSWQLVSEMSYPGYEDAHQALHFIREGDINGDLYLAGSRGHPLLADHDRIDLYRVTSTTPDFDPSHPVELDAVFNSRRITVFQNTGGGPKADLAAAAGFYESPTGELIFYATQHDNDGPGGIVNAGEWRHIDVVRPGSPTYLPTADVERVPYTVDEGGTVRLRGSARPPITRAWIELFHALDFGGRHFTTHYPMVDYADYDLDNFDAFFHLDPQTFLIDDDFRHSDRPRSLKWFAPSGCSIYLMDHVNGSLDEAKTLVGDGSPYSAPDLQQVRNDGGGDDIDREIDAVDFLDDCDAYYAAPFDMAWDLDINGSFESTGDAVNFDAAAFDGPSQVDVSARAQDRVGGTPGAPEAVRVSVRNVAPRIESALLLDAEGNELGAEISAGLPLTLDAVFTDQGVLDTQTASVNWGDGSVQTVFDTFSDARGGALGRLISDHRYAAGTYTLLLTVRDDDGATASTMRTVVARPADLALVMKGPADLNVQLGGEARLAYTLTVSNLGPGTAAGIVVNNPLPGGTQFVSASLAGGVCNGPVAGAPGSVTCTLAKLPSGATATLSLVIKMRPALIGITRVTNSATVSSGSTDPRTSNNSASAQTRVVSLLNR